MNTLNYIELKKEFNKKQREERKREAYIRLQAAINLNKKGGNNGTN